MLYKTYKKNLIRRSTRTGNKREAMRIARTWWVELMGKADDEINAYNDKLMLGRDLCAEYEKLDDLDEEGQALFWSGKTRYAVDAMNLFMDEQQKKQKKSPENSEQKVVAPEPATNKSLSDVMKMYIQWKTEGKTKSWADSSARGFKGHLNMFLNMVGDMNVADLTVHIIRDEYAHKLLKLPVGIKTNDKYFNGTELKPIDEIIDIAARDDDKRMSTGTVKSACGTIVKFLKWLKAEHYISADMHSSIQQYMGIKDEQEKFRRPYLPAELKLLFESEDYRTGKLMKYPERYWVPLISLFTGARRQEICQLDVSDVEYNAATESYFFMINDDDEKRLKTKTSRRVVPVHPQLIDLGLLRYIEWLRRRKETKLFQRENTGKDRDCGRKVGRWFNGERKKRLDGTHYFHEGYKHKCGIKIADDCLKDLHSFRHTLSNFAKQNMLNQDVIREIVGHKTHEESKIKGEDVHETYTQVYEPAIKKRELEKVKFDIDFGVIKPWP